jgi:hypothetical protein
MLEKLKIHNTDLIIILIFSLLGILVMAFVPLDENAYKWDSAIYLSWVRDFPNIFNNQINPYHIQKTFPSSVVNLIMRLFKIYPTDENIQFVFKLFNYILKIGTIYFWLLILNIFKLSSKTRVFSTIFLIVNINAITWATQPATIDTTAIFLFTIILWAYFASQSWVILLCLIPAAFTWPSLIYFSFFLYILPLNETITFSKLKVIEKMSNNFYKYSKYIPYFLFTAVILFIIFQLRNNTFIKWCYPADWSIYTPFHSQTFYLSILIVGLYFYLTFHYITSNMTKQWYAELLNSVISISFLKKLVLFFMFFIIIKFLIINFSSNELPVVSMKRIISSSFMTALIYPSSNILASLMWYGPIILLIVYNYKNSIESLFNIGGKGIVFVICLGLLFSINAESRYSVNLVQILLLFVTITYFQKLSLRQLIILSCIQMIFLVVLIMFKDITYKSSHQLNGPWISHYNYYLLTGFSIAYFLILKTSAFNIETNKNQIDQYN